MFFFFFNIVTTHTYDGHTGFTFIFIKKESLVQVLSCGFCEISKNYRTPPDDCFCNFHIKQSIVLTTHITHTRMQMASQSLYKNIVKFPRIDFLKTTGIAKDDIKVLF